MTKLKTLDLFSGIGGFSLGLERTGGFETVAFCEIEPFPRRVLARHWPEVPCYHDVRELTAERLDADGIAVDVICGGFPCQDISLAGAGAGLDGERSGLWSEYARLIGELRPRYVIVENVAALLGRGLGPILENLAALGYDSEWHCIPACAAGAPHRRDRVWIIAYPGGEQHQGDCPPISRALAEELSNPGQAMANSANSRRKGARDVPRAKGETRQSFGTTWWATEPDVDRVAHGVPQRMDRLKGLGNAVVPQIPELIGRAILASRTEAAA